MNTVRLFLSFFFSISVSAIVAQCGLCEQSVDIVSNGAFSQGNTGFSTDLNVGTGFFCPLCPEGTYAVGSFAFFYHSDFTGQDHTNPPNGQFMIVNGTAQEGIHVWCQTVEVQPNTEYTFRYWARDISTNNDPHPLGVLQASFDGVLTGNTIIAEGGWQENVVTWTSGDQTSAEVCIQNFQSNSGGNDFGIDDISMTACHTIQLSQPANAGADIEMCSGESVQLGVPAFANYSYVWSSPELLSGANTAQPFFTAPFPGDNPQEYSFTLTQDSSALGCISTDEIHITVYPEPTLQISGNLTFCQGGETVLTAEGTFDEMTWNTGSSSPSLEVNSPGIYSASASYYMCTAEAEAAVEMIEMPEIDLGPDQYLCITEVPVSFTAPVSVYWSSGINGSTIEVSETGEYWANYESGGCFVSDTVYVQVDTMPIIELEDELSVCNGENVVLSIDVPGEWSTGETGESITVSTGGIYSVTVQNGECVATASSVISEMDSPEISLIEDVSFCDGESVVVEPFGSPELTYTWDDGSVIPHHRIEEAGWHVLTVSNACGEARDSVFAEVNYCDWGLFIPNAFSPNNDEINDGWMVKGHQITNVKIFVYNRLGDLIWFSEALEDPWVPSAESVGQDAYTYRVEAMNYFGEEILRTGHIRLVR